MTYTLSIPIMELGFKKSYKEKIWVKCRDIETCPIARHSVCGRFNNPPFFKHLLEGQYLNSAINFLKLYVHFSLFSQSFTLTFFMITKLLFIQINTLSHTWPICPFLILGLIYDAYFTTLYYSHGNCLGIINKGEWLLLLYPAEKELGLRLVSLNWTSNS